VLSKPSSCSGCPLASIGRGYAPAVGPVDAPLAFIGEALGEQEATKGEPFVGPAGEVLNRTLRALGVRREDVRIDNRIRCQPPKNWLVGAPWERDALDHCRRHVSETLREPHKVVVTLGATATRETAGIPHADYRADYYHGCEVDPGVVATYHPAYLLQGNHKLSQVLLHDISLAVKLAKEGSTGLPGNASLVVDPPYTWFKEWAQQWDGEAWLAVDIETAEKGDDEEEASSRDGSDITRINFAYNPDQGVTVPWTGNYKTAAIYLLTRPGVKVFWNRRYDLTHLADEGISVVGPCLDGMDAWHVLQSDLPRSLGFVAPFYSSYGPWKHLSQQDPGKYAAIDPVQTLRIMYGVARDLAEEGRWDAYYNYCHLLDDHVLWPAENQGVQVDTQALDVFGAELDVKREAELLAVRSAVPAGILNTKVWKREPKVITLDMEKRSVKTITQTCTTCGAIDISVKHRCKDKTQTPVVTMGEVESPRWVRDEPFNPGSSQQVLRYMEHKGHKAGRKGKKKKTDTPSTDKTTLQVLLRKTKDPFYKHALDYRAIEKVRGTYVDGTRKRLRGVILHPQFTHKPSTMRLSCVDPNLQNVVSDRDGSEALAAGFRKCIVARPGNLLVEIDYSAIEAVLTGYFVGDPTYIRLAKKGVHTYLTSHMVGKPADLTWDDAKLEAYFKQIKSTYPKEYARAKRCVHGSNYGLTTYGMANNYPEIFTSARDAGKVQDIYFSVCPSLPPWHKALRNLAAKQGFLGGDTHPFRFKHYFWNVYVYDQRTDTWRLGEDAKRCIAFFPQSTAFGVLADACLVQLNPTSSSYIGNMGPDDSTPLRALIHDSTLAEVPKQLVEEYIEKATEVMTRPVKQLPCPDSWGIGEYLSFGVEAKVGENWGEMG
jgi:uracil-DNA glycosylase family 4